MSLDCPQGFVIPDDLSSPSNLYIDKNISECAISCLNPPIFTSREMHIFYTSEISSAAVGALLSLVVVVLWYKNDIKRKRIFVIAYGLGTICALIFLAIASSFGSARYCQNNANPINVTNGSEKINLCTVEAAILVFAYMSCASFFCMQSFEIFRKLVLGSKAPFRPWLHGLIVLGVPLVCSVAGLGAGFYGTDIGVPICRNNHHEPAAFLVSLVPVSVFTFSGFFFTASITVKTLWLVVEGHSIWDTLRLVSTPLHFIAFTGLYLLGLIVMRLLRLDEGGSRQQIMLDWGACALAHFDGTAESYVTSCGSRASDDVPFWGFSLAAFYIRGFGFCFFMVNIRGVTAELGKCFCPSSVQPAPYIELAPVSLNTSAPAPTTVDITTLGHEKAPIPYGPLYDSDGRCESVSSGGGVLSVMGRVNAAQDEFMIIRMGKKSTTSEGENEVQV